MEITRKSLRSGGFPLSWCCSFVCGPWGVRLVFLHDELVDGLARDNIVTKDVIGPC